jgi:hypothetical protein
MKIQAWAWLAGALILGPMVATAQTETLNYTGGSITGTVEEDDYVNGNLVSSSTSSLDGNITGSITLSSPLPSFGTTTVDPISGSFFTPYSDNIGPLFLPGESESFTFTTRNGAIVGWDIQVSECPCYGDQGISLSSSSGDSYSINVELSPDSLGTGSTYVGSATGSGGTWKAVAAPEIDPGSAASCLAVLVGGLIVLRGRKQAMATA